MNLTLKFITLLILLAFSSALSAKEQDASGLSPLLAKPLMERYILDDLKDLRDQNMKLRNDLEKRISRAEVEQTDRAAVFITQTIGNIFYLIAAAMSVLVFSGWNSLRDIRSKTESIVENRLNEITKKYNAEMQSLQDAMTLQSEKVLDNQNKIYNTQYVHSLWMRANLETNIQSKIDIYDEILKFNENDAEAFAYKADAVIDMDEYEWALSLSNKAIEIDPDYGYAYWQRSCANAALSNNKDAIEDLAIAIDKSPNLNDEIDNEELFVDLKETDDFKKLFS
jgi:tetratricopeptide (TPR) repeat protein